MFEKPIWIQAALAWTGTQWLQPVSQGGRPALGTEILDEIPREGLRQKKMMSHSAWLSYLTLHKTLQACGWDENREEVGYFLGVGASGSTEPELNGIVGASLDSRGEFSMSLFGTAGLSACNPLFAFQLMNNFTLCHGAILEKLGGPNAAIYSRGVGTVAALAEACFALDEGTATRALAGGADTALHPVTQSDLLRAGRIQDGLRPAEGAALLALSNEPSAHAGALGRVERVEFHGGAGQGRLPELLERAVRMGLFKADDVLYIAPWGEPARQILKDKLSAHSGIVDLSQTWGESLAASPAIAWVAALQKMTEAGSRRGVMLSAGIDDGLGVVVMSRDGA